MFIMIAYSVRFLNAYKNIKAPQCLTTVRQKEIFKEVAGALEDVESAVAAASYQAFEEE